MACNGLCKQLLFGGKSHIKGSKQCLMCDIFIITDSELCACCGTRLDFNNPELAPKPFIYKPYTFSRSPKPSSL